MSVPVIVVGGGLAGCEAAWQAANRGADVLLYEMRPHQRSPAHQTGLLAELVCSNSLRATSLENAVGLLKEELARLGSIIVGAARESAVPAGGALAVDRERFADAVERRLCEHPQIRLVREEVTGVSLDLPTILSCGPLPSASLRSAIGALVRAAAPHASRPLLHYYDAASPIVSAESLDETPMYRKSRYDKGDGDDYLNVPLDRAQYEGFVHDLRTLPKHEIKEFERPEAAESVRYFEGCLPIEELAARGDDALRYGPMKPVGLRDPRTGERPYAVVQLRKENASGTAYNMVGFQTRLSWPSQKAAFGKLPGFENAEWLRLGVMHRNAFIDAPRLLLPDLRLRGTAALWFAGQITGAEGYVEAAACGALAGIAAARHVQGLEACPVPADTALGAVVAHLQNVASPDFQPSNVTWAHFSALPEPAPRERRERRRLMADRALRHLDLWREKLERGPAVALVR